MPIKNDVKSKALRGAHSPRMDRRLARTRETLLSAAQSLFADRAVEAVSIDDIAATADVAKGTFYNHFGDKDAIATEVLLAVRRDVEQIIDQTNAGVEHAPMRVARALVCVLKFGLLKPQSARAMLRFRMYPAATGLDSSINAGVRRDVEAGMQAGHFHVASAELGFTLVYGVSEAGLTQVLDHLPAEEVPDFARQLGRCLLQGLGVRASAATRVADEAVAFVFTTARGQKYEQRDRDTGTE